MCVAATGYAFDRNTENGGNAGLKLGFFRVQGARIVQCRVKKSQQTEDGSIVYDGPMVIEKGEVYMGSYNVTGSEEGSPDAPEFALRSLFREILFPQIAELVHTGGRYQGNDVSLVQFWGTERDFVQFPGTLPAQDNF
jgi:hypothetical protein